MKFHQGQLTANLRLDEGLATASFNGDTWTLFWPRSKPRPAHMEELRERLNDATASTPKTHVGIRELTEISLRKAGLLDAAEILHVEPAQTEESERPEGSLD